MSAVPRQEPALLPIRPEADAGESARVAELLLELSARGDTCWSALTFLVQEHAALMYKRRVRAVVLEFVDGESARSPLPPE